VRAWAVCGLQHAWFPCPLMCESAQSAGALYSDDRPGHAKRVGNSFMCRCVNKINSCALFLVDKQWAFYSLVQRFSLPQYS
jgi:hypothetical protein